MKVGTAFLFLGSLCCVAGMVGYAGAAEPKTAKVTVTTTPPASLPIHLPPMKNTAFQAGESFTYVIKYEFVRAGQASLEVKEGPPNAGRPTFQVISKARSDAYIDVFFKVRDYNASWVDQVSLVSYGFHQNLREGHYKVMRNTLIDYQNGTFTYERLYKGRTSTRTGYVTGPYMDVLTSFFFARTLPLKLGQSYNLRVFSEEKPYDLLIKVHDELVKVKVPAGKFDCLRIQPFVVGDAIFKAKDGNMFLFLTNDERKMPVLIRSKVFIGSFDAELSKYKLP